jgi:glutamyl-tRNA reductase
MAILAAGIHHRSAPLELLEDVAISPSELHKVLMRLTDSVDVREAVVVSTCQRVEVYADVARFHDGIHHVRDVLCETSQHTVADIGGYLNTWYEDAAASHLFWLAAGLDSIVVGESEILGQVKSAANAASSEGTLGRSLRLLFRHAVEAAKRVRTETGISRNTASVASAAVALVKEVVSLEGQSVAVIGAGQAATNAALALLSAGAQDVIVVNRSPEAGDALAATVGGRRVGMDDLTQVLREVTVAICSTAAIQPVLTPGLVAEAMVQRDGRPLALVDIALPRDVHPDVSAVPGVTIVGLTDVRDRAYRGMEHRYAEMRRGSQIVAEEVDRWRLARAARAADPTVKALRAQAEGIADGELDRRSAWLEHLSPKDRSEVEALVRGLTRKLLHAPTVALRENAADPHAADLADAAAVLFDLEIE